MSPPPVIDALPHIIIVGNPVDGLRFFGPFPNGGAAVDWAGDNVDGGSEWWAAQITPVVQS